MKCNDVEYRSPNSTDSNGNVMGNDRPHEIVAWMPYKSVDGLGPKATCYTICWMKEGKESWNMETIGCRYTEYEDMKALDTVAKYALRSLNNIKNFEEAIQCI